MRMSIWISILFTTLALRPGPAAALSDEAIREWESRPLWPRLETGREIVRDRDAGFALTAPTLERDPDDLVASFLRARALGPRLESGELTDEDRSYLEDVEAAVSAGRPGGWIARATRAQMRKDPSAWRDGLGRARTAYRERGRALDAFYTLLIMVNFRSGDRDATVIADDVREIREEMESIADPVPRADALLVIGRLEVNRDYRVTLEAREEAVALLEPFGPGYQLATAWWGAANMRKRLGDLDGALAGFEEAVRVAEKVGAFKTHADALQGIAQIQRRQNRLEASLETSLRVLEMNREQENWLGLAIGLVDMRSLYHRMGRNPEARAVTFEAYDLCREHGLDTFLAPVLDNVASEEALIGRLGTARSYFEEALAAWETATSSARSVFTLLHLAELESDLGDPEAAMATVERGLAVADSLGHRRGGLYLQAMRARMLVALGRPEEGEKIARAALEEAPDIDDHASWDLSRVLARSLERQGRPREAIEILDSTSVALDGRIPDDRETVRATRILAELHHGLGELDTAEARAREGLRIARAKRFVDQVPLTQVALGSILVDAGQPENAIQLLSEGLAWTEESNSGLTVGQERSSHFQIWYEYYNRWAAALIRTNRLDEAFGVLERSRAREMRRAFRSAGPDLAGRLAPELAREIARVEADLSTVQAALVEAYSREPEDRRPDLADVEARAGRLRQERSRLAKRVERERPDVAREAGWLDAVGADGLRSALAPDERVLATMVGQRSTLVFEISAAGMRAREIEVGEESWHERVEKLVGEIRASDPAWRESAREIAGLLLPSGPDPGARALYVLADGPLHRLPFEVLRTEGDGGERSLVERFEIAYASSATLLTGSLGRSREPVPLDGCPLIAFGDPSTSRPESPPEPAATRGSLPTLRPLPHAREEVLSLSSLTDETCIRVGEEATESAFFRAASDVPLIHVAAHAFVDDERPEYSGIVLAPDPDDPESDGIVQAFEVSRADLARTPRHALGV